MKIQGYKPSVVQISKRKWTWRCAIWFELAVWADATITPADCDEFFDTEADAREHMNKTLKKFGVNKKTYLAL